MVLLQCSGLSGRAPAFSTRLILHSHGATTTMYRRSGFASNLAAAGEIPQKEPTRQTRSYIKTTAPSYNGQIQAHQLLPNLNGQSFQAPNRRNRKCSLPHPALHEAVRFVRQPNAAVRQRVRDCKGGWKSELLHLCNYRGLGVLRKPKAVAETKDDEDQGLESRILVTEY
jgi:hypothetical protein